MIHGVRPIDVRADIYYTAPSDRLKGKRIVVTGGGRGLGLAMARRFVAEGATVIITGRNTEMLQLAASELNCHWLYLDISAVDTFDKFLSRTIDMIGGLDCLVNNAGISLHEDSFFDVTPETFTSQFNTNLMGPFFLTQKVSAYFKANRIKGDILFISSETGETADIRPYGLTKASLNSLVKGLAYLFVKDGIRVNAIAPGITATDMTGHRVDGNLYREDNTSGRVYLPDEIAETATFLLSDTSGCISGQIIVCNNAKTINVRWK